MVRPIPLSHVDIHSLSSYPIPLALGLFVSVSLLVAVCAKQAGKRATLEAGEEPNTTPNKAKSASPKKLMAAISHKAMVPLLHAKKSLAIIHGNKSKESRGCDEELDEEDVWRKAIMMGEKCQPLEFSGVIFYDYNGNRVSEMPKSPRASSPFRDFSFPTGLQGLDK